jgi:putative copper resistance protein D/copper transport protein
MGAFSLVGTGVFARWVGPELTRVQRPLLSAWMLLGGAVIVASSLYLVYHTLWMLSPGLIWQLLPSYFLDSQQGNLVLVRLLLTAALAVLMLGPSRWWERLVHAGLSLGLLTTLTLTAHAGAAGSLAIASDLIHLVLNVAWAGSVLALAMAWTVARPELLQAVQRLSVLGAVAVASFWVTGVVLGLSHLSSVTELTSSDYGQAALRKVMVVLMIMGIAGLNRWWLLPQIHKHLPGLRLSGAPSLEAAERTEWLGWLVRLEAMLLLAVLSASGILASTPPPGPNKPIQTGLHNVEFEQPLKDGKLTGQWFADADYIHLTVLIHGADGQISKTPPVLKVQFNQEGQDELEYTVNPLYPNSAQYHQPLPVPAPGRWEAGLEVEGVLLSHQVDVPGK